MSESAISLVAGRELRRRLDVCDRTLARWRGHGMPAQLCGRYYRYDVEAVMAWIRGRAEVMRRVPLGIQQALAAGGAS